MIRLLKQSGSFIGDALKNRGSTTLVEFAKDGFDSGITSEVAVCRKSTGAHYCAVVIGMQDQSKFDAAAVAAVREDGHFDTAYDICSSALGQQATQT